MPRFLEIDSQFFTLQGKPLSGGKLYFYETEATTPKTTYVDDGLSKPNSNPVILDAAGIPPSIWFDGSAKVRLYGKDDVFMREMDPVTGYLSSASGSIYWVFDTTPKTADVNAVAGTFYFLDIDSASDDVAVYLPYPPSPGDRVGVAVSANNINRDVFVVGYPAKVRGSDDDYTMAGSYPPKGVSFIYLDATNGWVIYDNLTEPPAL